jgi:jacalin-like lectin domain-containing protein
MSSDLTINLESSLQSASGGTPPVALFQGYNTFTSAGRSTAVEGDSRSGGANAQTFYEVCYDISSLRRALNVSASVSASFGFGSVDAKSSFVESLNITNTSVTIVVYTNVISESLTQTNVRLAVDRPGDIEAFCRVYGDSYIGQIVTGAEYAAAYVFYSESIEQQRSLTATLKANGIGASGSLSGTLQASLNEVQKQVSTRKALRQFMSGFKNPVFPDADGIIRAALSFGAKTPDSPAVIRYDAVGYESVPEMPASFSSVVATRDLHTGIGAQNGLVDDYAQLGASSNSIVAIKAVYQTYGYVADTTLTERGTRINDDIARLDALFRAMATAPTATYTRPPLPGLDFGEPSLFVIVGRQGPFGGHTGNPFQQVDERSVAEKSVLSRFSAAGGSWLDRITFQYSAAQGTVEYTQGGSRGVPSEVMILQSAERVTEISGTYGGYVNSIELVTSFGNRFRSWPPTPQAAPHTFSWKAQPGATVFLGFAGRSGGYLDQLSIVTATFQPARWSAPLQRQQIVAA